MHMYIYCLSGSNTTNGFCPLKHIYYRGDVIEKQYAFFFLYLTAFSHLCEYTLILPKNVKCVVFGS